MPTQVETIVAAACQQRLKLTGYPSVDDGRRVAFLHGDRPRRLTAMSTPTIPARSQFTSSDGQVAAGSGLPLDYTFITGTGGDDGVHTFTATLKTAAPQSITVTDTAVPALTASKTGIAVTPAAATQIKIVGKTPSGVIAGSRIPSDCRRRRPV